LNASGVQARNDRNVAPRNDRLTCHCEASRKGSRGNLIPLRVYLSLKKTRLPRLNANAFRLAMTESGKVSLEFKEKIYIYSLKLYIETPKFKRITSKILLFFSIFSFVSGAEMFSWFRTNPPFPLGYRTNPPTLSSG